jgi:hypothetical protein
MEIYRGPMNPTNQLRFKSTNSINPINLINKSSQSTSSTNQSIEKETAIDSCAILGSGSGLFT